MTTKEIIDKAGGSEKFAGFLEKNPEMLEDLLLSMTVDETKDFAEQYFPIEFIGEEREEVKYISPSAERFQISVILIQKHIDNFIPVEKPSYSLGFLDSEGAGGIKTTNHIQKSAYIPSGGGAVWLDEATAAAQVG